eukprot:613139-Prymnesium_polylepis.1
MPSRVSRAQTRGCAHAHTTADRHHPVGGWRATSWRAQLAPRLWMAPAAAANKQTARARVRLQGSSSAAAVGAGASSATAHSAGRRRAGGARARAGWGAAVR